MDIGSLEDLLARARIRLAEDWSRNRIDTVTMTVVGIAGQVDRIVAANKAFDAQKRGKERGFAARELLTREIQPRQTCKAFSRMLSDQSFG